ncbi:MAG: adenylate cyclase [Chloroflexota bacterium]|nr:adenylate cyclase [Chloroflexota bacterium]
MKEADTAGATTGAMDRFPDQNPNPVLRMRENGTLVYANRAAAPILRAWAASVGDPLAPSLAAALRAAAAENPPGRVEVVDARQTFDVLSIALPDLRAYNLYGTDITAAKVVERFPDRNPNPVLRMTPDGELWYANEASRPITQALHVRVGDPLPRPLVDQLRAALADPTGRPPEVAGEGGLTFRLKPVEIPEFEFINLYGTDITAERAIDRFPNQNPNPVLRLTRLGRMTYANPASEPVRKALRAEVGDELDPALFARLIVACEHPTDPTIELQADGALYRIRVVAVAEFDSINLYGTDITAARRVEELGSANEALLLNILPASIAHRLRAGETVIADRFDDMAVLFADVVGFTELSARLEPTEVVGLLNEVFSTCDRLADQYGLEKIKTVGDAYMVVGGLHHDPAGGIDNGDAAHRPATHAEDVADMGLAMLAELARIRSASGAGLQVRVGMHVGPAVAGVIGRRKFIYDVWGDTVNMASRMESTGVPGRLQVARATYERLGGRFELEPRGLVEVKGKGAIETWFVVRRG